MPLKKLGGGQGLVKAGFLGFQGSGKTYTSVLLAAAIRKQFGLKGPIALIDSENATAYVAPLVLELTGLELVGDRTRDFDQLLELGNDCVQEGVSVLVADSMTHFWRSLCANYLAGVNEQRRSNNRAPRSRLEFADWGILKEQWAKWTDFYLNSPLHIIICGRAGYEYDMTKNEETGRTELNKTGIKMKTEGEFGFEPSLLVQMEMDQEPTKDGGFRQIRTGTVLKDRFGVIDGSYFQFRKGKDHTEEMNAVAAAFAPHLSMLKPGSHSTVSTAVNPMPVSEEGDVEWAREKRSRTILCEEIQGAIVSKHPGQSADEKKIKGELLAKYFGTRSWTAVESMRSETLRDGLYRLKVDLGIDQAPTVPHNDTDDGDLGPQKPQDAPGSAVTSLPTQKPALPPSAAQSQAMPLVHVKFLLESTTPKVTELELIKSMERHGIIPFGTDTMEELSLINPEAVIATSENWKKFYDQAIKDRKAVDAK
jgi:hypothetical protein